MAGSRSLSFISRSDVGRAMCIAAGAAPALVALAGEGVVKGSASAAEWVAKAMFNLSISADGKAKLIACGAASALSVLGAQPAVRSVPLASQWIGKASKQLAGSECILS